jgi:hypothetical protein
MQFRIITSMPTISINRFVSLYDKTNASMALTIL